jgi:acetyl esterase/lipase
VNTTTIHTPVTAPSNVIDFPAPDRSLAARLATAPGLVRAGVSRWDDGRTPIHPLSMESAYADPELLRDLGVRGARFARELGVDVVVGAETAGVPLAAAISLASGLPFAFVRKPGYRGHEIDEPATRGADVAGRRVLLVDDAVSSGTAVERFTAALAEAGVPHQIELYPGVAHGFAVPDLPPYNTDAAERHWERVLAMLRETFPHGA